MKIVIEVTDTGVNVYGDHMTKVDVFDCRELKETIEASGQPAVKALYENEYQRGLVHQTAGMFQIY